MAASSKSTFGMGKQQGMTRDMASHMRVVRLIWRDLDSSAVQSGLGEAYAEPTIRVGSDRSRTRRPDGAVIFGEFPTEDDDLLELVPVLVVEVVSPNNTAVDMFGKVEEYLSAGSPAGLVGLPEHPNRHRLSVRPYRGVQARRHHHRRTRPAWLRPPRRRPVPSTFRRFYAVTKARRYNPEPALAAACRRGKST